MRPIPLGWKFSVVVALLISILAFSYSIGTVNAPPRTYTVTFRQSGLDSSAIGTVVTVNGDPKTRADLTFRLDGVENGTEVTYSYAANVESSTAGKRFRLIDVSGPSSPIQVTSDTTVTGNYESYAVQYYLTVDSPYGTPGGEGWYDANKLAYATLDRGYVYDEDPKTRYVFTGWSGDASGTGLMSNPIKMDGAKIAIANWKTQHLIAVNSDHDDPTDSTWVDEGDSFTASVTSPTEIVPYDHHWVCTGFSVDGGSIQAGTNYTFTNVQAPHTIEFTWEKELLKKRYWIEVVSAYGSPTPSQWVVEGGNLTVSVTSPAYDGGVDTRYRCVGYRIDDGGLQAGINYTFTDVQAEYKIEFLWLPQHLVTFTESGLEPDRSLALTVNGTTHSLTTPFTYAEWFDEGFAVEFNITQLIESTTPDQRYASSHWIDTLGSNISSPQTIIAPDTFTAQYQTQYYLRVDTSPSGLNPQPLLSPSGSWYDKGTLVTCTVQSVYGYAFDYWIVDGSDQEEGKTQITVTMNAPHAATAHYESTGVNPSIEGLLQVSAFFGAIAIFALFGRIRAVSKKLWNYAIRAVPARFGAS